MQTSSGGKAVSILNPLDYMVDGCTLRDGISCYAEALSKQNNEIDALHSTKVIEYAYTLDAEKVAISFMQRILKFFKQVVPDVNIHGYFRIKSFLSFERKINYTLVESWKKHHNVNYKTLINGLNYGLNDIIGFRFLVHGNTEEEAISSIYRIANLLLPEMTKYGLIPQEHPKLKDIELGSEKSHSPELCSEFEGFFKDYIFHKKKNGYQSLHIIFWSAVLGRYFEIQLRTPKMHFHAEYGKPAHRDYKEKKYNPTFSESALPPVVEAAERLKLLRSPAIDKINIKHFFIDATDDGEIGYFDGAGLLEPLICKEMVLIDGKIVTVK